jgi:hypothetical protein
LVQLADPPPVAELRPRHEWITYNEPEQHLDDLCIQLARLPGLSRKSQIVGLTYKDDSSVVRMNRLGFTAAHRFDSHTDLGIAGLTAGIESVQEQLTRARAEHLVEQMGRPDLLLVRHVLEHCHDIRAALSWASTLVGPRGYVVFETPDATRALDRLDYTTVWEEHTYYFTPCTLRNCLERHGFEVISLKSYPYTLENSLVVIARANPCPLTVPPSPSKLDRAQRFLRGFAARKKQLNNQVRNFRSVAILGAGHLTGAFVNLYNLVDCIRFVVDDNPRKQGLFMPGSRLPILPARALLSGNIELCLMTVRPEIEKAVVAKNAEFTRRGGVLASVFPDSPYTLDHFTSLVGAVA